MKTITSKFLKAGAFACLAACYSASANAAVVNVSVKKSDLTSYGEAIVSYKALSASTFGLLGKTDAITGELSINRAAIKNNTYVFRIAVGPNVTYDTVTVGAADEVVNLHKTAVAKYVKFTDSDDMPYVDHRVSLRNLGGTNTTSLTDVDGVAAFEIFQNAEVQFSLTHNGQVCNYPLDASLDTIKINTVGVTLYWPHEFKYGGVYGQNYTMNSGASKTIEVIPSDIKMLFTSNHGDMKVSNEYTLTVDNSTKKVIYTPVHLKSLTVDGDLTFMDNIVMGAYYNQSWNYFPVDANGAKIVMVPTNRSVNNVSASIGMYGRHSSTTKNIGDNNNIINFSLSRVNLNTVTSDFNNTVDVTYQMYYTDVNLGAGYHDIITNAKTNTPATIDIIPGGWHFQSSVDAYSRADHNVVIEAGTNSHDFSLSKISVSYTDNNWAPLDGGSVTHVTGSGLHKGMTDANGSLSYYAFLTNGSTHRVRLEDAARSNYASNVSYATTYGADLSYVFVNTYTSTIPVSDMISLSSAVSVYPNPATNNIQVKMGGAYGEVSIFNLMGQLVYTNANVENNASIDISTLPTGTYNVVVVSNDTKEVVRVVKH